MRWSIIMRKSLLVLLLLTSCASFDAAQNCQKQAGPKPYAAADAFGLIGVLAVGQTDERQAWYKSVDDCMAAWRAKEEAHSADATNSDKNPKVSDPPAAPQP